MHILIPQTEARGAHIAAARLRGQGDTVSSCYDNPNDRWCTAVAGKPCPLDKGADMVVVVRPYATPNRLPHEEAVVCAAARCVPVVIAGAAGGHPYAAIAAADYEGSDVTSVVRAVASAPLVWHSTVATAALRECLGLHGVDAAAAFVDVHRRTGGLAVRMHLPSDCPDGVLVGIAAVRVLAVLSEIDPRPRTVDVSADRLPGAA